MIVWLLGISGAGKSTLGNKLKSYYDSKNIQSCIIDGDIVRDFFENDLGFSKEDRVSNIKRIMLSAYLLEQNNIIPIVCNISPFQELRDFSKKKFNIYLEIYLKKEISIAQNNDVKSVYKTNNNKTPLVGVNLKFDKPLNSDLILNVDEEEVEVSFEKLICFLESRRKI